MSETGDLEAEYNNRARVPEHPAILAAWARDAAAYRRERSAAVRFGLAYGGHPRQRLDLFLADDAHPARPVALFIHGGYWQALDGSSASHFAAGPNARGLDVAIMTYRLCPEVGIGDIADDVRAACLYLFRETGRGIVAFGHSAGGHLAAAAVATDWQRQDSTAPADLVRSGLAISGVFDLEPLIETSINGALQLDVETARALSPFRWPVPRGARLEAWVGGAESGAFRRQSRDIADAWQAAGAETHCAEVPGANHFTVLAPLCDPASPMVDALVGLAERDRG
ncbi:alpha/beta hydrolase [Faunimonas sp. B44]|uniref:alpha/beta hydrolase n=1 Tax=Faunimonas sp. B44 TaxID=3461493 RepID=UPI004044539A